MWLLAGIALVVAVIVVEWPNVTPSITESVADQRSLQVGITEFELMATCADEEVELVIPIVNIGRRPQRIIGVAEG
jgi:hypothetical protein